MNNTSLTVLSLNSNLIPFVQRPYLRIDTLSRQPEVSGADVINLQEVHTYDLFWTLRRKLTKLPYASYQPSLFGPKGGLVTFSRLPLRFISYTKLSTGKGVLISHFGESLLIVNIHLIANTDGDWSKENRFYNNHESQLAQLSSILQNSTYINQPTILSGDFNFAKTCDLYGYFIQKGKWQDTTIGDYSPTFHEEFLPIGRTSQRIDYVLIRNGPESARATRIFEDKINGRYLSNHMGLLVELSL